MRRFRCTGLFALGATLLALASAQAQQQTYTQNLNFQTSNQSMWNTNLGQAGYDYNIGFTQSWNTNGNVGSSSYRHVFILGTFGAGATVNTKGQVGLNLDAYATSGAVNVNYPMTLTFTYPDPSTLSPGQTFTLTSAYTPGSGAQMTTQSPDAGVRVNTLLQANPIKVNLKVEAFSHNIINNDLINTSFNINKQLFDSHNLTVGQIDLYGNILTGQYHPPVVNTSGKPSGTANTITTSGQDPFITFTADFSNAVADALGLPPFSGTYSKSYRTAKVTVDYSYLDLFGGLNLDLAQNFKFTPHPMVTLNLSSGQPVTFEAGQSVQLTMPADGSALTITPSVALNNQFTNITSIKGTAALIFEPASISAHLSVVGVRTPSISYQVPLEFLAFGTLLNVPVYSQAFDLGGFTPQNLPAFTLTPPAPPTPLMAQDDFYAVITPQDGYYTLNVPAPGVLTNDSGPSGFSAVPQYNDAGYTFILNSDGSLSYQVPDSTNPGIYTFPYQITDGQGHTATANIYIQIGG